MPKIEDQPLSVSERGRLLQRIENNPDFRAHRSRLEFLIHARFGNEVGLEKTEDSVIVDLGCGSPDSSKADSFSSPDMYEAWFPRVCAAYGAAQVIGIDLFPQDPADATIYNHIQANLVKVLIEDNGLQGLLKGLKNKVDIITSLGMFRAQAPSSTFALSLGVNPVGVDPFKPPLKLKTGSWLLQLNLIEQANSLLKPGGVLLIDLDLWKKTERELKPVMQLNEAAFSQN